LVFRLSQVPVSQLLPWYVLANLLIVACICVPTGRLQRLRQAAAFLLPDALPVVLTLPNLGSGPAAGCSAFRFGVCC
jgi:hypothetical protein